MNNKLTTSILLLCLFVFLVSCHTKQPEHQQTDLEIMLADLVEDRMPIATS